MSAVLSAGKWRNNAELMVDFAQLYINEGDFVLDPTYGEGSFWTQLPMGVRNFELFTDDLNPEKGHGGDFRRMTWADNFFDVTVFDPTYVTPGGRDTVGEEVKIMYGAYGMDTAQPSLREQWFDILLGLDQCIQKTKPGGLIAQKSMPYVSSGRYHPYERWLFAEMAKRGLIVIDELFLVRPSGGPQPPRTRKCRVCRGHGKLTDIVNQPKEDPFVPCSACDATGREESPQVHSRANVSSLLVARKPRRPRKRAA